MTLFPCLGTSLGFLPAAAALVLAALVLAALVAAFAASVDACSATEPVAAAPGLASVLRPPVALLLVQQGGRRLLEPLEQQAVAQRLGPVLGLGTY